MLVELILVPIMSGGGVDLGSLSVLKVFRIARVFRMARIVRSVSRRMLLTRGGRCVCTVYGQRYSLVEHAHTSHGHLF